MIKMYLMFFILGLLGLIFSNLRKFISIRRKGTVIDYNFTVNQYLKMDWDIMAWQLLTIIVCMFLWNMAHTNYPILNQYGSLLFFTIGVMGAEILNLFLGKAESYMVDKIKNHGT